MNDNLVYALKNEELVHVGDVQTGLACGCVCPKCDSKIIAKNNGEIREHHFAHDSENECVGAMETVGHIMGKKIISDEKFITTPNIEYDDCVLIAGKKIEFMSVLEEEKRNGYTVDVSGYLDKRETPLLIEIRNTHEVDEAKKHKVEKNNEPMMEIDIRWAIRYLSYDVNRFKDEVLLNVRNRKWINNPKAENIIKKYKLDIQNKVEVPTKNKEQDDLKIVASKLGLGFFDEEKIKKYSKELLDVSVMHGQEWFSQRRDEIAMSAIAKQKYKENLTHMRLYKDDYKIFSDVPKDTLMINVPKKVWASGVYKEFFYDKDIGTEVFLEEVAEWVREEYGVIESMHVLNLERKNHENEKKAEFNRKVKAAKTRKEADLLRAMNQIEKQFGGRTQNMGGKLEPRLISLESDIGWYLSKLNYKKIIYFHSGKAKVKYRTLNEYWNLARKYHNSK